jgi:hypothetical protein
VSYRFENERFVISSIELALGSGGEGTLRFVKQGLGAPVDRKVSVGPDTLRALDEALGRLNYLAPPADLQGPNDHSNLGTVSLAVSRAGSVHVARFNYTHNRDARLVADLLGGIANREIHAFGLETAARYTPLETAALLGVLESELRLKRVAEPEALVPLLRDIGENFALPLLVRNKAVRLADSLAPRGK